MTKKTTIAQLETTLIAAMVTIQELQTRVTTLEALPTRSARNYGPASDTPMTDQMAWRIRYGDLTNVKVKTIADENGLSRGQVYSVRGNYTFTKITANSYAFNEETNEIEQIIA